MRFYSTVIPRTSTDKALNFSYYMSPRTSTDTTDKVFTQFASFCNSHGQRATDIHNHPLLDVGSHGPPRTATDSHGQRHFVQILKLFASQATEGSTERALRNRASGPKAESTQHPEALSTQHSRACAVSSRSRLPSWDCVGPATASLGLAVWDAALGTGGGKGKIPSLILRLTLPAWSVR